MAQRDHDRARERGRADESPRAPGEARGGGEARGVGEARAALRAELVDVRDALQTLLDDLERVEQAPDSTVQSAVVTSVVTRTNLLHTRR